MKMNKDQRQVISNQLNLTCMSKKQALEDTARAEIAKLDNPYKTFFDKLSRNAAKAKEFCAALADWRTGAVHAEESVGGLENMRYMVIPIGNSEDAEGVYREGSYRSPTYPVFKFKELDAEVAAWRKKISAIREKYDKRIQKVDARCSELHLRVQLLDMPEDVLKMLDEFKAQEF